MYYLCWSGLEGSGLMSGGGVLGLGLSKVKGHKAR